MRTPEAEPIHIDWASWAVSEGLVLPARSLKRAQLIGADGRRFKRNSAIETLPLYEMSRVEIAKQAARGLTLDSRPGIFEPD
jgi:hypothetical protein